MTAYLHLWAPQAAAARSGEASIQPRLFTIDAKAVQHFREKRRDNGTAVVNVSGHWLPPSCVSDAPRMSVKNSLFGQNAGISFANPICDCERSHVAADAHQRQRRTAAANA
jgi:hypothetical protein